MRSFGTYEAYIVLSYERFGTICRSHLQGSKPLSLFILLHTVLASDDCHKKCDSFRSLWCGVKLSTGLTLK